MIRGLRAHASDHCIIVIIWRARQGNTKCVKVTKQPLCFNYEMMIDDDVDDDEWGLQA